MTKKRGKWSLIWRFSRGSRRYFFAAAVASLLMILLNSYTPQVFRYTIDAVLGGKESKLPAALAFVISQMGDAAFLRAHLWRIAALIVGIYAVSGLCTFISRYYSAAAGECYARQMRNTLFAHVQRLPMRWHEQNQTGDIIQRCTSDLEVIRNFTVNQLLEVVRTVLLITVSFWMMWRMSPRLSMIEMVFLPFVVASTCIFSRLIAKRFQAADEAEGELSTLVQENATGVRVVRAFGREQHEVDRFDVKNQRYTDLSVRLGTLNGVYWAAAGAFLTRLQVVIVIVLGSVAAVRGELLVGEFVAFASYNLNMVWPLRELGEILAEMSKAGVSFDRVNYILDAVPEEPGDAVETPPAHPGEIAFSHVNFSYDGIHPVCQDLTFTVPEGTMLGILGGTGSGKSTLVQLLDQLYEIAPGQGEITLGGVPLSCLSKDWIRSHVGIVLQEPFLFSRTIRENIAMGKPDATMEEIREAARIACVDDTILSFPDGYDTLVGEQGVTLSGGQRQRVAIARMVLMHTPIMIFDDSLSAVDAETDLQIRMQLRKFRRDTTIILISHRITSLMGAEQIMVLQKGRVAQKGTHEELVSQEGLYRKIYEIQMNQDDRVLLEGGDPDAGL